MCKFKQSAKIKSIVKAAGLNDVEAHYPFLFAKVLAGKNVGDLLANIGGSAAPAPAAAAQAAPAKEEKKDDKKDAKKDDKKKAKEPEPADDDGGDMGFGSLF